MAITRRNFIIGVGAGLILPSIANRILGHFEATGEPLLEAVAQPKVVFHALDNGEGMLLLDASVPYTDEPPDTRVTWREFFANEVA